VNPNDGSAISTLVDVLGEPASLFVRLHDDTGVPSHHCRWPCGCTAENRGGLCLPSGWVLSPCAKHMQSPALVP
jgi:hypothetical protein